MSMLEVNDLSVHFDQLSIIKQVSFSVESGEHLVIVGPNGAGKSTLVNAIVQGTPYTGKVFFEGEDVKGLKSTQLAHKMGMLMQNHYVGYDFTVEDVVSLGRYAHTKGIFAIHSDEDKAHIADAVKRCGLEDMLDQSVLTLSGGELQRTFLAQAFAQDPQLLILDEPTNHLDLVYQKRIFELIDEWLQDSSKAVLSVVHDLSLARAFSSRVMLMCKGELVALDTPEKALSDERLQEIYGMDVNAWMRSLYSQWL